MASEISTLSNGLTLIVEEIPGVESAAYDLLIPGGYYADSEDRQGCSIILSELTSRGAGSLDAEGLSNAFDDLGVRHGEGTGSDRIKYGGSLLAEKLDAALELVAMTVLEPTLPTHELDGIKSVMIQDITSLSDHPSQKVMIELSSRYFPGVFGRSGMGTKEGIEATSIDDLRSFWERTYRPKGAVLSIAGKVKAKEVQKTVEKLFGTWSGAGPQRSKPGTFPPHSHHHVQYESAQLQIALIYPSARFAEPHFYTAKVANGVLSGGMFGRLFIEVREKRGLCYSVYSRHAANKDFGYVQAYAGTTPERAQETLEVMLKEMRNVKGTVTPDELMRSKANIKASLIIGEESTSARAASNASDWWTDGRVRSLDEIQAGIDKVSIADIDSYFETYPAQSFMMVTLGSRPLTA